MINNHFTFIGGEGLEVFTYKWECEENQVAKGVVQIAHGMSETAARYEEVAEFLTSNGYHVYINDHRGHGKTAKTIEQVGILATDNGFYHLVEDMHRLTTIIKEEQPNLPIYLFGHSMGSFASQRYMMKYGHEINGVILSGSNGKHGFILNLATPFIKREIKKYGRDERSPKIDKLMFGGHNRHYKNPRTDFDWLSRDPREVDKYINDPYCGVVFTSGFFYDFVQGLKEIERSEELKKVPTNLPIYIFSGDCDPVGQNGKGVIRLKKQYEQLGVQDLSCKLYPGGRHEMLNEMNKYEVFQDILGWLNHQIN